VALLTVTVIVAVLGAYLMFGMGADGGG